MTIKDSGERTEYATGAVRDLKIGKGRMDLIPWDVIIDLSKHYELGALKYGAFNWQKGINCSSYLDSALRHLAKYASGMDDEPHLIAAIWNLVCLHWTEIHCPNLQDIKCRIGRKIDYREDD